MAGKSGRNGNAQKNYYAAYKAKAGKQRQKRLEKHQKLHPNDKQGGSTSYRKNTPENVSGWLTPEMDSKLTPTQVTPITIVNEKSGRKETVIPDCASSLKEMTKSERKRFSKIYARVRKVHAHAQAYGKKKEKTSK